MICPLLSACRQKVTMEHYSSVCANVTRDAYKECPEFKRLSSEQRTPVEWARLTAPAAT
jgi:hypothetical protein